MTTSTPPTNDRDADPDVNRRMLIASLPDGQLAPTDFSIDDGPVPEPEAGQVLCRTLAITIGAGQWAGLRAAPAMPAHPNRGG